MPYKYKSVDTSTLKGLKKAEWYHAHGWKIISTGLFIIQFQKKVKAKHGKNTHNQSPA